MSNTTEPGLPTRAAASRPDDSGRPAGDRRPLADLVWPASPAAGLLLPPDDPREGSDHA